MYAISVVDIKVEAEHDFRDGSFFGGHLYIEIEWDGDWKIMWAEGTYIDPEGNETEFKSDSATAHMIIQKIKADDCFYRKITDWTDDAIQEHRSRVRYWEGR